MIVDVHTHICPPQVCDDRSCYLLPVENAFCAIYQDEKARLAQVDELLAVMNESGVDKAVTFGFPWVTEDFAKVHNDYILEAQNAHPSKIAGMACFDPLQPWAAREAERALDAGMKGLGELAVYSSGFDEEALGNFSRLADICRERSLPMMVHVNEPIGHQYPGKAPLSLKMIYNLVKACEGMPLILAHWGGGLFFYNLLKKEVPAALENVYYDTAASPFLYKPEIYAHAARIVGPEKVLFGTDYPLLKPGRYFKEMEQAGLSNEALRLIKGDAAARLFFKSKK